MFKNSLATVIKHLINLGMLISGRGSNMDAILAAIKSGRIRNAKPCIVISNEQEAAGGLGLAAMLHGGLVAR